jgi:hypothetical protein
MFLVSGQTNHNGADMYGKAIMQYATEHYNEGGWDMVVECYTVEEIDQETKDAATFDAALNIMRRIATLWHEMEQETRYE